MRPAASRYAVVRALCADAVAGSAAMYFVPEVVTEALPVKVPVGDDPMSDPQVPERVVGPVLVIPEPAKTAKVCALPRFTVG